MKNLMLALPFLVVLVIPSFFEWFEQIERKLRCAKFVCYAGGFSGVVTALALGVFTFSLVAFLIGMGAGHQLHTISLDEE